MSLSDFPYRDEYPDHDDDPVVYRNGYPIHLNPAYAPRDDQHFAAFSEALELINNATPEVYNSLAQHRRAYQTWIGAYATAVFADQSFLCHYCASGHKHGQEWDRPSNSPSPCEREHCRCVAGPHCGQDYGPACQACGLKDLQHAGDWASTVAMCSTCAGFLCGQCWDKHPCACMQADADSLDDDPDPF